jgi:hypothetical protein
MMIEKRKWRILSVAPVAWGVVVFLLPFPATLAAVPITLEVEADNGLPGLAHSALLRFLAAHMADARLAEWSFKAAQGNIGAPDRVEWIFRLNPYVGGEVRQFAREPAAKQGFGVRRPVTIEAQLYLNGEYQTLVERQATVQGGADDLEFAAAVASATESLLGPRGAYRGIDMGQRRPPGTQ